MSVEWFYQDQANGQHIGPISLVQLHTLAGAGVVARDTMVKRGADGAWMYAELVQGLFERDEKATELEKRRRVQTGLVYGLLGCATLAGSFVFGSIVDATIGDPNSKLLDGMFQGALLVAFVGILRGIYVILTTPLTLTKQAICDRQFWRLRPRDREEKGDE